MKNLWYICYYHNCLIFCVYCLNTLTNKSMVITPLTIYMGFMLRYMIVSINVLSYICSIWFLTFMYSRWKISYDRLNMTYCCSHGPTTNQYVNFQLTKDTSNFADVCYDVHRFVRLPLDIETVLYSITWGLLRKTVDIQLSMPAWCDSLQSNAGNVQWDGVLLALMGAGS